MPTALVISEYLLGVLVDLGEHGVLDTSMLYERHADGRTLRAVQIALSKLADDGLVFGTQLTVSKAVRLNSRGRRVTQRVPTVWTLSPKGGDEVEALTGARPPRVQTGEPSPATLLHRVAVVRTRLAFDASCRRAGLAAPVWIHESDVREDAGKKMPPNQRSRLYHRYEVDGRIVACRPDAVSRVLIDAPESAADAEPAAVVLAC